jgi:hypothetical protein
MARRSSTSTTTLYNVARFHLACQLRRDQTLLCGIEFAVCASSRANGRLGGRPRTLTVPDPRR